MPLTTSFATRAQITPRDLVLKANPNHGPDGRFAPSKGQRRGGTVGPPTEDAFGHAMGRYRVPTAQSAFNRGGARPSDPRFDRGGAGPVDQFFNRGPQLHDDTNTHYDKKQTYGETFGHRTAPYALNAPSAKSITGATPSYGKALQVVKR